MSQGSLNPKNRFLGQKVCPVARSHTDTHTDRVTTESTVSGFQDFFLEPIVEDLPNITEKPYCFLYLLIIYYKLYVTYRYVGPNNV